MGHNVQAVSDDESGEAQVAGEGLEEKKGRDVLERSG